MGNKGYGVFLSSIAVSLLILMMLAGCSGKLSDNKFSGVWDYLEYNVKLQIFDDNTWEMLDAAVNLVAGGNCVIDGDTAELYYTYGSPWENEDDPVMYTVLHYKKKGKLSDGMDDALLLTEETPISHSYAK